MSHSFHKNDHNDEYTSFYIIVRYNSEIPKPQIMMSYDLEVYKYFVDKFLLGFFSLFGMCCARYEILDQSIVLYIFQICNRVWN